MIPESVEIGGRTYDTADLFSVETVEGNGGTMRIEGDEAVFTFPADISHIDFAEAAVALVGLSRDLFVVAPSVYLDPQTGLPTVSIGLDDLVGTADPAGEGDEDDEVETCEGCGKGDGFHAEGCEFLDEG